MTRCLQLIGVTLVCLSLGLHWIVLQSVAWTTMVIERSCSGSLSDALSTTFDGQHPCKLCRVVQEGQSAEDSSGIPVHGLKLEGFAATGVVVPQDPSGGREWVGRLPSPLTGRAQVPPVPPPRAA